MYKVVYNGCFGGFSLSAEAVRLAKRAAGKDSAWTNVSEEYGYLEGSIERHDPVLVAVVERLGKAASGRCADLKIAEIESNTYRIDEYDGSESVEVPSDIEWTVIK
jgi:hypothetical protein